MDRLDKAIELYKQISNSCDDAKEKCKTCKRSKECDFYCDFASPMDVSFYLNQIGDLFSKEPSIQLKNIDISGSTLDKLFDEVIKKNEECKYALTNLIELIKCNVNKEYLKEHYIEKILDQLQANINIASVYGIKADDIMKYYNNKYLDKID